MNLREEEHGIFWGEGRGGVSTYSCMKYSDTFKMLFKKNK